MSTEIINKQKKLFLEALPNTYDKSEGTVIVDFATANALANEHFYIEIENLRASLDYRVSEGESLTDLALNFGIYRKEATFAEGVVTFSGNAGASIPVNFIVSSDTSDYATTSVTIVSPSGTVDANIVAIESGTVGNAPVGTINKMPISINGINSVINGTTLDNAIDTESDEDLRARIDFSLRYPPTSGNVNHYYKWATEVSGVGGARIIVKPSGAGSMRVAIVGVDNETAPQNLIDAVEENIYLQRPATSGTLEVVSATPLNIDVAVTGVTLDSSAGISISQLLADIITNITEYVNSFPLDATAVTYIGVTKRVVLTEGLADYVNLTLNGGTASVPITGIELPKANAITATV